MNWKFNKQLKTIHDSIQMESKKITHWHACRLESLNTGPVSYTRISFFFFFLVDKQISVDNNLNHLRILIGSNKQTLKLNLFFSFFFLFSLFWFSIAVFGRIRWGNEKSKSQLTDNENHQSYNFRLNKMGKNCINFSFQFDVSVHVYVCDC